MTPSIYILIYSLGTVFAWGAWGQFMRLESPVEARGVDFFFFYLLLFLAMMGTMTLLGMCIRWRASDRRKNLETITRQAFFYALFVVGLLSLQSFRLLRWWNLFLFLFLLTLLEFFFLLARRPQHTNEHG